MAGVLVACDAFALDAAFSGAWVGSGTRCDSVFVEKNGVFAFREPVDSFAVAFVINGKQLRTPGARCRITGVRKSGERQNLSLICTTTIASDPVTAIFARPTKGSVVRFANDADETGSTYHRCLGRKS